MTHELIGVDWGTSNMRAMLCRADGARVTVRDVRCGPGVVEAQGRFAGLLRDAIEPWRRPGQTTRILMSGMIGSNIGWREAPYLSCPLHPRRLAEYCPRFSEDGLDLAIVPGLRVDDGSGRVDVMRGEELQTLGWLDVDADRARGRHLLCLPGTHTKWVEFVDGRIESFTTAVSGELYGLMRHHSTLFAGFGEIADENSAGGTSFDESAFDQGVQQIFLGKASLLHSLFGVRSRLLLGKVNRVEAESWLSGVIVASDLDGASALDAALDAKLSIIAAPAQIRLYSRVMQLAGRHFFDVMDGTEAAARGYAALHRSFAE